MVNPATHGAVEHSGGQVMIVQPLTPAEIQEQIIYAVRETYPKMRITAKSPLGEKYGNIMFILGNSLAEYSIGKPIFATESTTVGQLIEAFTTALRNMAPCPK
jgi:hypothetical protein